MHNTIKENYFKFGESIYWGFYYINRDQWGLGEVIIPKCVGIRLDHLEE